MLEITILVAVVVAIVGAALAIPRRKGASSASSVEASRSGPARARSKKTKVMSVAGIRYKNSQGEHCRSIICRQVRAGDTVELIREPNNPYDKDAVRVLHRGDEIGYVPKEWNRRVIGASAHVERVEGLDEVAEAGGIWMGVFIDVEIRCQVR